MSTTSGQCGGAEETGPIRLTTMVECARGGDRRAFDLLVARFQRQAVGYAASLLRGDLDQAEDAVQAAFVEAWRDLGAIRDPAAFAPWLRRIVFKHCDRLRRRERAMVDLAAITELPAADGSGESSTGIAAVRNAVASLPPGERAAVLLVYVGGGSPRAAASYLGISVAAVRGRLHSARRRLRERMARMDPMHIDNASGDEWIVDPAEEAQLRSEILSVYARMNRGFERLASMEDVDMILDPYSDDYTLIFPEWMRAAPWDLARCREDLSNAVGLRRGTERRRTLIDDVLSVERAPETRQIARAVVRMTFINEGFPANGPIPRIDTWIRTPDGWKMQRTLSLYQPEKKA